MRFRVFDSGGGALQSSTIPEQLGLEAQPPDCGCHWLWRGYGLLRSSCVAAQPDSPMTVFPPGIPADAES
eukprot:738127-Rhodomonas_salina.2